ncbi:MAG: MFS transporter, partial [Deltaproteobacteria bacterium]|nr:MFS transporter [Deltaproteobacteria bacterium]
MIRRPYPFYYGWIIVAVSFLTIFFVLGTRSCFGLFYTAILAEYGWGRAETAGAFSLMMIFHACMAPFSGILIDRFGPRKLFPIGAVIVGIGLAASSLISEIWHLYLYFGIITAMGTNMQSYAPHMSLIPRWFIRRRGLASGLVLSGMGPGTMLLALLIGYIIGSSGWRYAYMVLSAIIFCVVVPMNAIFQRNGPEDVGQNIEGTDPAWNGEYSPSDKNHHGHNKQPLSHEIWTFKTAARTKAF